MLLQISINTCSTVFRQVPCHGKSAMLLPNARLAILLQISINTCSTAVRNSAEHRQMMCRQHCSTWGLAMRWSFVVHMTFRGKVCAMSCCHAMAACVAPQHDLYCMPGAVILQSDHKELRQCLAGLTVRGCHACQGSLAHTCRQVSSDIMCGPLSATKRHHLRSRRKRPSSSCCHSATALCTCRQSECADPH